MMKRVCVRTVLTLFAGLALTATPASTQEDDVDDATKLLQEGLPLTPTRTLSETFTEGSWISLDVSPDGEQLFGEVEDYQITYMVTGNRIKEQ